MNEESVTHCRKEIQDLLDKKLIRNSSSPWSCSAFYIDDVARRAWNYVAVGCGRDLQWWKAFFSVVRMMGYNDWVSLEMEDLTMSVDAGIASSVQALQQTISQ